MMLPLMRVEADPDDRDDNRYTALTGQPKKQFPKFTGMGEERTPVPAHCAKIYPSGDLSNDWSPEDEEWESEEDESDEEGDGHLAAEVFIRDAQE